MVKLNKIIKKVQIISRQLLIVFLLTAQIFSYPSVSFSAGATLHNAFTENPVPVVDAVTTTADPDQGTTTGDVASTSTTDFLSLDNQSPLTGTTGSPDLAPSVMLTTEDIVPLPGHPGVARVAPENNLTEVSVTRRGIELRYDTSVGGWAGGGFAFDDFSTLEIETEDLSPFSELVFGLRGDVTRVKFEIVDDQNQRASIYLAGTRPDAEQVWSIPMDLLEGVDLTKVNAIFFIVEGENVTGRLWVNHIPAISPSTILTTSGITPLPGDPGITRVAPEANTSEVAATSRGVTLLYDTEIGGWAGGGFTFDDFNTSEVETADLSAFSELVFGLKGDTSEVKFEIVDDQNRKASVHLTGIRADQEQVWRISRSLFEGVDLARTRLIYFIVDGENQFGVLEINRIPISPLPEGWTRAASNPNYAYRIYAVPSRVGRPSYWQNLEAMNLITGEIDGVASAFTRNVESLHDVDVLPDSTVGGVVVVYKKTHTSGLYDSINLKRFGKDESFHLAYGYLNPIRGTLIDYTFNDHQITFSFTSGEVIVVNLETFQPQLPEGWTRATSNPNYAFRVEDNPLGGEDLKLMDLRTGQIRLLQERTTNIVGLRDVSPDNFPGGSIAISQIGYRPFGANSSPAYTTSIQRIQSPSERELISSGYGELLEISFEEDQALLRFGDKFFGPDAIEDIYLVKGIPLQVTYEYSKLVATPENIHVDSDTPLVIRKQIERTTSGSEFVVLIYDSSEGLDRLHKLLEQSLTIDSGGHYTFSDGYATPNGKQIVSIGLDTDHSNMTVIVDARTGEELRLDGAATAVQYHGRFAEYTLVNQEGVARQTVVDIETFQVLPTPVADAMLRFYGWDLPRSANYSWEEIKDLAGKTVSWQITVIFNQSTAPGQIQNQLLILKEVQGQFVIKEVRDRDYKNSLITRSVFYYDTLVRLSKIKRYNKFGLSLSTIYVRRPMGKDPYYKIVTLRGKKEIVTDFTISYYALLKQAANMERLKG